MLRTLVGTSDFIWNRLAAIAGCSCEEIRHATLFCGAAMIGWLCRDTFEDLRTGLFGLVWGNIADNVSALARGDVDCSTDTRLQQIKRALDGGEPQEHVVDMLELMMDTPFVSTMVEEGHASAAVLRRHHSDYSEESLRCRALLHQQRALFRPCLLERQIKKNEEQLSKLRAKRPDRVGPRPA